MSEVEADNVEKYYFTFKIHLMEVKQSELGKEGTGTHKTTDELDKCLEENRLCSWLLSPCREQKH